MTEIPPIWLWVSGIYFAIQTVFVFCLIIAVINLIKSIKEITPKVEALTEKVQSIGDKVEDLTDNVKSTMEVVGVRAKSVAGSADMIAHTASRTFERFSPVVVGILSAIKIFKAVQDFRSSQKHTNPEKKGAAEAAKALAKVDKGPRKKDN